MLSERKCAAVECQAATEELEQAKRLVRQGDRYLAQGNVAVARQYFVRAANLGLAMAALKIAETYDPNELARLNVYGLKPNLAEARRWYQRAFELDMPEEPVLAHRVQAQGAGHALAYGQAKWSGRRGFGSTGFGISIDGYGAVQRPTTGSDRTPTVTKFKSRRDRTGRRPVHAISYSG